MHCLTCIKANNFLMLLMKISPEAIKTRGFIVVHTQHNLFYFRVKNKRLLSFRHQACGTFASIKFFKVQYASLMEILSPLNSIAIHFHNHYPPFTLTNFYMNMKSCIFVPIMQPINYRSSFPIQLPFLMSSLAPS